MIDDRLHDVDDVDDGFVKIRFCNMLKEKVNKTASATQLVRVYASYVYLLKCVLSSSWITYAYGRRESLFNKLQDISRIVFLFYDFFFRLELDLPTAPTATL